MRENLEDKFTMSYYEAVPQNLTLAELKLDHISPEWIKETEKPNYLKKALRLLKDDGRS